MKLVIVDTPAQAKHVADTLDEGWQVEACLGGIRDLPTNKLGIDMLHDFQPSYALLPRKGNLVRRLMRAIANAEAIYIAMPPGRKGETIAWHILTLAPTLKDKPVYRTSLTAVNPEAIRSAFAAPRELNLNWIDAEISRRMVDQLVAFLVSPLANQVLNTHMTISRAALICLGMLVAHERTLQPAQIEMTWKLKAHFVADSTEFQAGLYSPQGKTLKFKTREQANSFAALLTNAAIWVDKTGSRTINLDAPQPYTPVTLIAEAEARLGIEPAKTLELVQTLYEAGWLIYPADEITAISPQSLAVAQDFIRKAFGHEYTAGSAPTATGSNRPDHLCPAEIDRLPEQLPGDGAALYGMIWHRFVASMMSAMQTRQIAARILVGAVQGKPFPLEFRAQAEQVLFEGWRRAGTSETHGEPDIDFPHLADGIPLTLKAVQIEEAVTEPRPRMTSGTIVAALGVRGIDRSEEYIAAIQTLIESGNAELNKGQLVPTERGAALIEFVEAHFGNMFSASHSVELERDLEQVAAGEVKRIDLLRAFWAQFGPLVTTTAQTVLHQADRPTRTPEHHRPIVLRPLEEG